MTQYSRFLLALLLAVGPLSCAESRVPGRDTGASPKLTRLDPGTLSALRTSFNAAAESVRVLVMLSPT